MGSGLNIITERAQGGVRTRNQLVKCRNQEVQPLCVVVGLGDREVPLEGPYSEIEIDDWCRFVVPNHADFAGTCVKDKARRELMRFFHVLNVFSELRPIFKFRSVFIEEAAAVGHSFTLCSNLSTRRNRTVCQRWISGRQVVAAVRYAFRAPRPALHRAAHARKTRSCDTWPCPP